MKRELMNPCQEEALDFKRRSLVSACLIMVETLVAESHSAAARLQVYIVRVLLWAWCSFWTSYTFGCGVNTPCICRGVSSVS